MNSHEQIKLFRFCATLWLFSILPTQAVAKDFFDPIAAPSSAEWRHFHQMTDKKKLDLWRYQTARGLGLGQWAWQWRIGWVKHCVNRDTNPTICPIILSAALKDKAMVVRAEAATVIGQRFEKRPTKELIEELRHAFHDPRNRRRGEPLFVCGRILEALQKIGGQHSIDTATKLAQSKPSTKAYWSKLSRTAF
jgi:hypothetical protein